MEHRPGYNRPNGALTRLPSDPERYVCVLWEAGVAEEHDVTHPALEPQHTGGPPPASTTESKGPGLNDVVATTTRT
jgi:hypothetical protein